MESSVAVPAGDLTGLIWKQIKASKDGLALPIQLVSIHKVEAMTITAQPHHSLYI